MKKEHVFWVGVIILNTNPNFFNFLTYLGIMSSMHRRLLWLRTMEFYPPSRGAISQNKELCLLCTADFFGRELWNSTHPLEVQTHKIKIASMAMLSSAN
jgi:hypothetical protein